MKKIKIDTFFTLFMFVISVMFVGGNIIFYLLDKNTINAILMVLIDLPLLFFTTIIFEIRASSRLKEKLKIVTNSLELVSAKKEWDIDLTSFLNDAPIHETLTDVKNLYDQINKNDKNVLAVIQTMNMLTSDMELDKLFENVMPNLLKAADSSCGAFYKANNTVGKLEICYSLGFNKNIYNEFDINIGEGLVGSASISKDITIIDNIPNDTIFLTKTFLGIIVPKSIMIIPIIYNEMLLGTLCLASIKDYKTDNINNINMMRHFIGISVSNCLVYDRTTRMAKELKFQNSLIQGLNQELENKVTDKAAFLKNIINSLTDIAIYVCDRNGTIKEWNSAAETLYGHTEAEIKGKNVNILFTGIELSKQTMDKIIKSILENGYFQTTTEKTKSDGSTFIAETKVYGLFNDLGELVGVTNIVRELTKDSN